MAEKRAPFKESHSFEDRKDVADKIREKYPDRLPVIVEKHPKSDVPLIDKYKFLVPNDIAVGKFKYEIRKHMRLSSEKAIFLFVGNVSPPTAAMMSQVYDHYKDEDGFLYVTYSGENVYGNEE
mmetsp:Transcript_32932/g.51487  ORF Transcript_32932/g.51487 Transcript_32932/m.51487 type:complete len:123 (-) Transcript_32932:193-561(-)